MAVGHHVAGGSVAEDPGGAETNDNPFRVEEMVVGFGKVGVHLIKKAFFGGAPEVGVVAESAVVALPYLDDLVMAEGLSALQAKEGHEYAEGVVERSEGVHLGIEAQATADTTNLIGEAGAQEEEAITVEDGLGKWGNCYFGG